MRYLPRYSTINKLGLSLVLCAFTIAIFPPANLQAIEFNDVATTYRIVKLAEKGKKYLDKMDGKNLIEVMWELKKEIEAYSNQKFDIDNCLTEVFKEVRKTGHKVSSKHEKELRKMFKKKKVRFDHRAEYRAMCFETGIKFDTEVEFQLFQAKHGHDKEDEKIFRVQLSSLVGNIIKSAFGLLGITVPERM